LFEKLQRCNFIFSKIPACDLKLLPMPKGNICEARNSGIVTDFNLWCRYLVIEVTFILFRC